VQVSDRELMRGDNHGTPAPACLLCVILLLTVDGVSYDVSVLKKKAGKMRTDRTPSKATIINKTRPAGSFSSS
jgi:hypothetical protein